MITEIEFIEKLQSFSKEMTSEFAIREGNFSEKERLAILKIAELCLTMSHGIGAINNIKNK